MVGAKRARLTMAEICAICGEPIPFRSRICPNCLYNDSFYPLIREVESPIEMLGIMRSMMEEYLAADMPTLWRPDSKSLLSAIATFESVRDVVMLSFGKNMDVVDAVVAMEDILYEQVEQRRKRAAHHKIIAITLVIILISSLFVLIYLEPLVALIH